MSNACAESFVRCIKLIYCIKYGKNFYLLFKFVFPWKNSRKIDVHFSQPLKKSKPPLYHQPPPRISAIFQFYHVFLTGKGVYAPFRIQHWDWYRCFWNTTNNMGVSRTAIAPPTGSKEIPSGDQSGTFFRSCMNLSAGKDWKIPKLFETLWQKQ